MSGLSFVFDSNGRMHYPSANMWPNAQKRYLDSITKDLKRAFQTSSFDLSKIGRPDYKPKMAVIRK